jgi:DNA-binding response OmpR family regulator
MKTLLITDRSLAESLQPALEEEGVLVDVAEQTGRAEFKVQTEEYDAVLLDRNRLEGRGYSCLLRWRRGGLKAHVLVLLPGDSKTSDRADTLDAGADAYLLQPLCVEELRAHLRALRRRDESVISPVRRIHDLEINTASRSVRRSGQAIRLTPREFDLLALLAYHQGRVVSRSMIREHLYDAQEVDHSNVVDVYIRYLRNKIDKGFDKPLILTRWGQGYLLRAEGA